MPSPGPEAERPLVAVLVGPTAAGKTAASIAVAQRLPAEVVSADSRYLYRGLDIGTAKPRLAERQGIPHHLIDVTTPDRPWTLAQYQAAALGAVAETLERGRLPLLVGGTGQYVRALVEGWEPPPADPAGTLRRELEAQLQAEGLPSLAVRLRQVDPESAQVVDLRNPRRVLRALEVMLLTGESFVSQRRRTPPPYRFVWLGLTAPRPELYARIDARIDAMLAAGLVAEVQGLANQGYGWDLPAMSALGYRQIGAHLRGECSLEAAVARLRRDTRGFVRRQANWFKQTDPNIHWVQTGAGAAEALEAQLRAAGAAGEGPTEFA
jgi:tRNA dimethylallyltransferase